jgi:hypothetical protein
MPSTTLPDQLPFLIIRSKNTNLEIKQKIRNSFVMFFASHMSFNNFFFFRYKCPEK